MISQFDFETTDGRRVSSFTQNFQILLKLGCGFTGVGGGSLRGAQREGWEGTLQENPSLRAFVMPETGVWQLSGLCKKFPANGKSAHLEQNRACASC